MTETVEGTVTTFINKDSKQHCGMLLDNNDSKWYNKKAPVPEGLGSGSRVRLEVDESKDFLNIKSVTILEEADNNAERGESSSRESAQESSASLNKKSQGVKSASSNTFQSQKSRDITVKVAFKEAVDQASTGAENQGEHLNEVNELASGYISIMEGLAKEINGDGNQ